MTSNAIARQLIRKSISQLTQGSTLTFRSKVPCSVIFQPEWRDDGMVSCFDKEVQVEIMTEHELQTSLGRVTPHICMDVLSTNNNKASSSSSSIPQITVQIPEKINLNCHLFATGSVSIPGKIEGDVVIQTNDGTIQAKKLRGHSIDLQSAQHPILISELIEAARLRVQTKGRFRAKQVHCSQADIQVFGNADDNSRDTVVSSTNDDDPDDEQSLVDISALFLSTGNDAGSGASIQIHPRPATSHRAVRIKSNHGPILVQVMGSPSPPTAVNEFTNLHYPLVELGGVNGQCEVSVSGSSFETASHQDWVSCQVHLDSLSLGSVSLVTADCGHVAITVDRKVAADLRLLSHGSQETLVESGSLLAEEEDAEMIGKVLHQLGDGQERDDDTTDAITKIQLLSPAFSKTSNSFSNHTMEYVDGAVENKSAEPDSRFDRQSGKIRIDGAGAQALSRFSDGSISAKEERPLFAVVGMGNIVLETVSWFGAIARRYGLEESERELGRTASRRGRSFAAPPPTRS